MFIFFVVYQHLPNGVNVKLTEGITLNSFK